MQTRSKNILAPRDNTTIVRRPRTPQRHKKKIIKSTSDHDEHHTPLLVFTDGAYSSVFITQPVDFGYFTTINITTPPTRSDFADFTVDQHFRTNFRSVRRKLVL